MVAIYGLLTAFVALCAGVLLRAIVTMDKPQSVEAEYVELKADFEQGKIIEHRMVNVAGVDRCVAIMRDERKIKLGLVRVPEELSGFEAHVPNCYDVYWVQSGVAVISIKNLYARDLPRCSPAPSDLQPPGWQ